MSLVTLVPKLKLEENLPVTIMTMAMTMAISGSDSGELVMTI